MFGSYSNGVSGKSAESRLPAPFSPMTSDWKFPPHPECNDSPRTSDSSFFGRTISCNLSNARSDGGSPGNVNKKGWSPRPSKEKYARQRGGFHKTYNNIGKKGPRGGNYYCDSCDRGFLSLEDFQNHCKNDHITCGMDGCTLSAHPKVVEKHQKIQHASGLYLRLMSNASQNPEDVAKWIAERKKNYPTRENIERRKEEEEERLKRGECLRTERGRFGHFGRSGRGRERGGRRVHGGRIRGGRVRGGCIRGGSARGDQLDNHQPHPPRDRRGRGKVGRGNGIHKKNWRRNSNQVNGAHLQTVASCQEKMVIEDEEAKDIAMFAGTAALLGMRLEKSEPSDEVPEDSGAFSDSEWILGEERDLENIMKKDQTVEKEESTLATSGTLNNALGVLMGAYESDYSNSDEDNIPAESKPPMKKRICRMDKIGSVPQEVAKIIPAPTMKELDPKGVNLVSEAVNSGISRKGEDSDGSAPEEVSIRKEAQGGEESVMVVKREEGGRGCEDGEKRRGRRCRKRGRCKENRKVVKEPSGGCQPKERQNMKREKPLVQNLRPRCPTLLEELLKDEIRHERNVILQCVRYVIGKYFFDAKDIISSKVDEEQNNSLATGGGIEQIQHHSFDVSNIHFQDNEVDVQPCVTLPEESDAQPDLSSKNEFNNTDNMTGKECDSHPDLSSKSEIDDGIKVEIKPCIGSVEKSVIQTDLLSKKEVYVTEISVNHCAFSTKENVKHPKLSSPSVETDTHIKADVNPSIDTTSAELSSQMEINTSPKVVTQPSAAPTKESNGNLSVSAQKKVNGNVIMNDDFSHLEEIVKGSFDSKVQSIVGGNNSSDL